jgi:hypothetical protein
MLGTRQTNVLRWVHEGPLDCGDDNGLYRVCMRLEARRLVGRMPSIHAKVFVAAPAGEKLLAELDRG